MAAAAAGRGLTISDATFGHLGTLDAWECLPDSSHLLDGLREVALSYILP
jgi:hypothetical protein